MGELKDELIEIKDYLKKSKIYYKVVGSDKIHTITPTTYGFLKGKVFDLEKLSKHSYYVKDNISYIHFHKSLGEDVVCNTNYIRTINPNTKVLITMDDKESYKYRVYAKDVTIRNERDNKVIFTVEITDSINGVNYNKGRDFVIYDASKVILCGNPKVPDLTINSSFLEVSNISEYISSLIHRGEDIKLNNINCNLLEFETDAENIEVQNSNIKNSHCSFNNCVNPIFVNSTWKVNTPLRYVDGTLGNSETGITITDETFSKESIELGRAYATYGLREFLNNVKDVNALDINPKLKAIDERKITLKEEYDRQIAVLEDKKDVIINGYQKRKVKNLVRKKEN